MKICEALESRAAPSRVVATGCESLPRGGSASSGLRSRVSGVQIPPGAPVSTRSEGTKRHSPTLGPQTVSADCPRPVMGVPLEPTVSSGTKLGGVGLLEPSSPIRAFGRNSLCLDRPRQTVCPWHSQSSMACITTTEGGVTQPRDVRMEKTASTGHPLVHRIADRPPLCCCAASRRHESPGFRRESSLATQ